MRTDHHYWFPAKRYGWGWAFPTSWEGRLVLIVFFALIVAGFFLFPPTKAVSSFMVYTIIVGALLVCSVLA